MARGIPLFVVPVEWDQVQKVLNGDSGVRLGRISLDIREARPAEVAKDKMHVRIEEWDKHDGSRSTLKLMREFSER